MRERKFMNSIIILGITVIISIMFGCAINGDIDNNNNDDNEGDIATQEVVYVRDSDGNDSNPGTQAEPKKTIQAGIDLAEFLYTTAEVHVAEGTYSKNYNKDGIPVVLLKDGISIYGGYSDADWNISDPLIYITIIKDDSTTDGALNNPNRTIEGGSGITENTIIHGFKIVGGEGQVSFAMFNYDGASPTIQNNIIYGGSNNNSAGIYNVSSSSPIIQRNTIIGGSISVSFGICFFFDFFSFGLQARNIIGIRKRTTI